ncbi:MAG: DUF835 domain-containing protein [Candidatus Thermoplasmatota archaeon]|nr:DUF835 domain-containing protein [Candidatus Thermoplasmatota archaeon]
MSQGRAIAETLKGASSTGKIKKMESIRSNCRRSPAQISSIARYIIPLLRDSDAEVRLNASKLVLEFSKLDPRAMASEAGRLIDTINKVFTKGQSEEEMNWEPYANLMWAMGNISEKFPDIGAKCLNQMTRALKYPIYHPEHPVDGLHLLYAASIKAIGQLGRVAPAYVTEEAIPLVYKALVDSFRFQFWIKPLKKKDEDMKSCAIQTLTKVGVVLPTAVVPSVTTAFLDKDRALIKTVRKILFMLTQNIKFLFPALMDALDIDKKQLREYITKFIVEVGKKDPHYMIPQLTYRMEDPRKYIRFHCAAALGQLFPSFPEYIPSVIPVLIDHLANDKNLDVRQTVSDALNVISEVNVDIYKDYIKNIIDAMDDEYHHVRWRMSQIIMNIGRPAPLSVYESIPYLIAGLSDRHDHVQWKCREALEVLNVDKIEYQLTVRNINVGRSLIKKAKKVANIELPECTEMLDEATKLAKQYKFKEAIKKAGKAKKQIEKKVPYIAEGGMKPGQMPPGYMQMPGYGAPMQYPQTPGMAPGYFGPPPAQFNQAQASPDKKKENEEKYRKAVKRALKDGIVSEDEEEMLSELRDILDISTEDHEKIFGEEKALMPKVEPDVSSKEGVGNREAMEKGEDITEAGAVNWSEYDTWGGDGAERESGTDDDSSLEDGYTYLLENDDAKEAFTHLSEALDAGKKGLFITRDHPRKVTRKYKLDSASHIWLTKMPGETNLRPNQLDVIRKQSEAFLNNSKGGVLVMDGLDYLVTHNDFEGVFNLVQSLKDLASVSESIIILSVGQSTLEETEMKSLEREVDDVL